MAIAPIGLLITHKIFMVIVIKGLANIILDSALIYTSQLFPTLIKARATAVASICGKAGGLMMPLIMYSIVDFNADYYFVFVFIMVSVFLFTSIQFMKIIKYPDQHKYCTLSDDDI